MTRSSCADRAGRNVETELVATPSWSGFARRGRSSVAPAVRDVLDFEPPNGPFSSGHRWSRRDTRAGRRARTSSTRHGPLAADFRAEGGRSSSSPSSRAQRPRCAGACPRPDVPADATPMHAVNTTSTGFLAGELGARKALGYPPFRHLVSILVSGPSPTHRSPRCGSCGHARGVDGPPWPAPAPAARPSPRAAPREDDPASLGRAARIRAARRRGPHDETRRADRSGGRRPPVAVGDERWTRASPD